jgi:transcription elongation factor GreA
LPKILVRKKYLLPLHSIKDIGKIQGFRQDDGSGFFCFLRPKKGFRKITKKNKIMAYMSQEGYDKLIAELHRLEAIERPKASAAIAEAREKGDLSENSEYDAAKEAQAHLEDKINRLKTTISEAKVVDTSRLSTDSVQILTKVEMTNLTTKTKMSYTIVSENEADLRAGKISIKTPIAQGLLGKKVGDEVEITIPRGTIKLRIDNISIA